MTHSNLSSTCVKHYKIWYLHVYSPNDTLIKIKYPHSTNAYLYISFQHIYSFLAKVCGKLKIFMKDFASIVIKIGFGYMSL